MSCTSNNSDKDDTILYSRGKVTKTNLNYCIKSLSTLLYSFKPYTKEIDKFRAPYVYSKPLSFKDAKEKRELRKHLEGLSADKVDCFNSFFKC
jgi:hypothetical protein